MDFAVKTMVSTSSVLVFFFAIASIHSSVINAPEIRALADCKNWYAKQIDPEIHLKKTLKPPCRIPTSFPSKLVDNWSTDPGCDAKKQPNTCSYHVGAYGCYRHSFQRTGPGAQACYDKNGNWLADPWLGAGTLDVETPLGSLFQQLKHVDVDVTPYNNCCKDKALPQPATCNMYFEKRPPGQCEDKPAI